MRQIGTIADETQARILGDYLLTLDIGTRVDPLKAGGFAVWVRREDQVERARRALAEFLANPADPKYQGVSHAARQIRKEAERKERLHQKNTISLSGRWAYRTPGRSPLTIALIGVSVFVALLSQLGEDRAVVRPLELTYRLVPRAPTGALFDADGEQQEFVELRVRNDLELVARGEVWRLVTPIFLHFGPWHLVFNMLGLYDLGGLIEMRKGTRRLFPLVLVSAVASNLAEYFWMARMPVSTRVFMTFGGMSGVVLALFGYVWMRSRHEPEGGMYLGQNTITYVLIWVGFCIINPWMRIANAAHVAGLLIGMAWGIGPHWREELRRWT